MFKWKAFLTACALCCALSLQADTTFVAGGDIGGFLRADESPFIIQGDVYVSDNSFLFIDPGVTVYFDGHYQLEIRPGAEFTAIGMRSDSIYFTTDTLANPERWAGIYLSNCVDTIRFEYCVFEFAGGEDYALRMGHSPLIILNSTVRYNQSEENGGAIYTCDGYVRFADCAFEHNRAWGGGAIGLFCTTEGTIERCLFYQNRAGHGGALATTWGLDLLLRDCDFFENQADGDGFGGGGAIWFSIAGGHLENCEFTGNQSRENGGAITSWATFVEYNSCVFRNNHADSLGGAVYIDYAEGAKIQRCLFDGNTALRGGGLAAFNGDANAAKVIHSTFVGNSASLGGGIYWGGYGVIINTVVAFNLGGGVRNPPQPGSPNFRGIHYSSFYGNEGGDIVGYNSSYYGDPGDSTDQYHNQFIDPRFVNLEEEDYHLRRQSPLIDAGFYMTSQPALYPLDPDSTLPDIGAYYFDQSITHTFDQSVIPEAPLSTPAEAGNALSKNLPNPFNAVTEIEYQIASPSLTTLKVYDVLGREVATLVNGMKSAGNYTVMFDGARLPSGVYIYRLQAGEFSRSRKMVLLK